LGQTPFSRALVSPYKERSGLSLFGENVNAFTIDDFEKLALPLLDRLHGFACSLSGNSDEASDLVQESLTKALKAFGSFREGTNFGAWIFTILRNTFLNARIAVKKQTELCGEHEEDGANPGDNPERILIRHAEAELVQQAIAKLSPGFREVLLLADINEMAYRDIAQHLGIPPGTVMSRLSRARKKLRDHLVDMLNQQDEIVVRQVQPSFVNNKS
jgi:RNA polymerase sigma-70 factor (ECF subfamily)